MEVTGQLHAPSALSPYTAPGSHWIGDWVGARAGLEAVAKENCPCREYNPGRPAPILVTILRRPGSNSYLLYEESSFSSDNFLT